MKQETTALLISALLLSTFAHEHLQRAHHQSRKSQLSARDNTDNDDDQSCQWVCPSSTTPSGETEMTTAASSSDSTTDSDSDSKSDSDSDKSTSDVTPSDKHDKKDGELQLVVNRTSSIIAIYNSTAQIAWAYDVSSSIVAVFNGSSGSVVMVNLESRSGVYITAKASREIWISSSGSFEVYISRISSLTILYKIGQSVGTSFTESSVSTEISETIGGVLIYLSRDYAIELSSSYSRSYKLLFEYSSRITVLFKGSLKGFFSLVQSSRTVAIRGDIKRFAGILEGFGEFVSQIRGGSKVLIERSVKFDIEMIFSSQTGIESYVYVVRTVSTKIDISYTLSYERVFSQIIKFSGSSSTGFSGFINAVYTVIKFSRGEVSIDVLINNLIEYSITDRSEMSSVKERWESSIKLLLEIAKKLNRSGSLDDLIKLLKDLRENRLVIRGVKISEIITVFYKVGTIAGVDFIVRTIVLLTRVVKLEIAMVTFFYNLVIRLNSRIGYYIVTQVFSDISFSDEIKESETDNVLAVILKRVTIVDIRRVLVGDFSRIPVLGKLISRVSTSVERYSQTKIEISSIFRMKVTYSIVMKIVTFLTSASKGQGPTWQGWQSNWGQSSHNKSQSISTNSSESSSSSEGQAWQNWSGGKGDDSGEKDDGSHENDSYEHGHGHGKGKGKGKGKGDDSGEKDDGSHEDDSHEHGHGHGKGKGKGKGGNNGIGWGSFDGDDRHHQNRHHPGKAQNEHARHHQNPQHIAEKSHHQHQAQEKHHLHEKKHPQEAH